MHGVSKSKFDVFMCLSKAEITSRQELNQCIPKYLPRDLELRHRTQIFIFCFALHATARVILERVVYRLRNQYILVGQDFAL